LAALALRIDAGGRRAEGDGISGTFDLFVFSTDAAAIETAVGGGVAGVVVDWERVGKRHRQTGADTQIGEDTAEDLQRVRGLTSARILCRIDNTPDLLNAQVDAAIELGADEVLLPMVRSAAEVEALLARSDGRCGVGILVETQDAIDDLHAIAALPLARVYVGLNDLAIERGATNIFDALVDGTVDEIRAHLDVPVGVAGLTLVDCGAPIPCLLLIGELARLDCSFSFLRRSYHADVRGRDARVEIRRLLDAIAAARRRSAEDVARDRSALIDAIDAWAGVLTT
jgi:2-keto-3-deoxy-L-rhamnonate aldolase RhmA